MPFSTTTDIDEEKMSSIQPHHTEENPLTSMIRHKPIQLIESTAFMNSNLKIKAGFFLHVWH